MLFGEKVRALIASRRFWAAFNGVGVLLLGDLFGLDEQTSLLIVGLLASWIVGDSLRPTK